MSPRRSAGAAACGACGAPLHGDQRYCLQCGERHGAPRVDPLEALGFPAASVADDRAARTAGAERAAAQRPAAAPMLTGHRRAPSRRLTAALTAATLVGGALVGAALGPGPAPSVAAAPQRLVALVIPGTAPIAAPAAAPAPAHPPSMAAHSAPPAADASAAGAAAATGGAGSASSDDATSGAGAAPAAGDPSTSEPSAAPAPAPAAKQPSSSVPAATVAAAPHVWVISLSRLDATAAFGPASPLADLVAHGTLLRAYAPAGPTPAANDVALLTGVVPTADCAADLTACVQPATQTSLPDELRTAGKTWRAYVDDPAAACAGPTDRVAASLLHSLVDRPDCTANMVAPDALTGDLATAAMTPALSLLTVSPDRGQATGAVHDLVARITSSAAYADGGVVLITVDAPPVSTDPSAPLPAVGTLVLARRAAAGKAVDTATGPVALLRSLESLFGLSPAAGAAGPLDAILAPPVASASVFPHRSHPSITTRRSP